MSSKIAFAVCSGYGDPVLLRQALEKILKVQIESFGSIAGKRILVKPNLLAWRRKNDIACVRPEVILQTVQLLLEHGASVEIMETPAVQSAETVIRDMGLEKPLAELDVPVSTFREYERVPASEGIVFRKMEIASAYRRFDAVLDLAKAKTHGMMTLTLCVKNLFGLVRGSDRLGWHLAVGRDYKKFADMLLDLYLTVRPDFNIIDGITCMEGNGPGSGTPAQRGFLAGGTDALALDHAVAEMLGVPDLLLLQNAKKRGLSVEAECVTEIPVCEPLKLPSPPGIFVEWGVFLPFGLKKIMREYFTAKPVVEPAVCIGCGLCAKMCPPQSLKIVNRKPKFDLPNCIRCFCCQEHCPKGAITIGRPFGMKIMAAAEKTVRKLIP